MKIKKYKIGVIILVIILIFIYYLYNNKIESFTDINNIKIILNNPPYEGGFFSIFNMLLASLIDNPNTTEIQYNIISNKNSPVTYYINDNEEIFSKIFQEYKNIQSTNTIEVNSFVENTEGTKLYWKGKELYNENRNKLQPFNDVYKKYIILQPHIEEKIKYHINILKDKRYDHYIGVLVRSAAVGDNPGRKKYLDTINKLSNNLKTKYFLLIDNEEDLNFYKNNLKPNYYININRSPSNKGDAPHKNTNLKSLEELENVFIQVAVLSSCDILVHGSSNMATTSLIMNMEQKSVWI